MVGFGLIVREENIFEPRRYEEHKELFLDE
jgi:hypothetical protein